MPSLLPVTLHGFTGAPSQWEDVVAGTHLALLGHSTDTVATGAETFAQQVQEIAAQVSPGTHLAGYSMGGRLALAVALECPQKINRLTLVGAHPGLRSESERTQRLARDEHWIRCLTQGGIETFVNEWESQPLWASQAKLTEAIAAKQRATRTHHDAKQLALALACLGLGRQPNLWNHLEKLTMPVQLICGELDEKFHTICEDMAKEITNSEVVIVSGCGHNPVLEAPQVIADILVAVE